MPTFWSNLLLSVCDHKRLILSYRDSVTLKFPVNTFYKYQQSLLGIAVLNLAYRTRDQLAIPLIGHKLGVKVFVKNRKK